MPSRITLSILDYSMERSPVSLSGVNLSAGNFVAQAGLMDAFVTAIGGVILGTISKDDRFASHTDISDAKPASPFAQRENKWLVRFTDNVDPIGNGTFEIPTPDLDLLNAEGTHLDMASAEGIALKAAVEAYGKSRLGNAITMVSAQYVGRNI